MTRAEALKKAQDKFTNLYDGSILPRYGVKDIILYYETLVLKNVAPVINRGNGILDNFLEEEILDYENDNDYN